MILYGGEDFELVLTLPHQFAEPLRVGNSATIIGEITQETEVKLSDFDLDLSQGFQRFSNSLKHQRSRFK
ncbi:hypothetical protein FRE64_15990 [Euhalothece natronophila Z-M001]|uniref:PurM-like C-terminal domain-containing protein n=1 Tax=Euhalothece natronophila Z-M001 TaxID=522448 RepID=A0A5B8NQS2_9CHRO|nr:hypothetical protein [Euhalothece natronophila]QDZ41307.1 hypothetical protein FRE64_15990 [Euhalothece natronophila Z-M001]